MDPCRQNAPAANSARARSDSAATLGKLTQAAKQFDASKVKAAQLAASGGSPSSDE